MNDRRRKPPRSGAGKPGRDTAWDPVAAWYDKLVGETGMDYHRHVILPAAMEMLAVGPGAAVIDVCCGQGVLAGLLLDAGVGRYTGIDASKRLIQSARARFPAEQRASFLIADACLPGPWADGSHDAAACLMAVHDVADAPGLFRNIAASLRPGGHVVIVMMHPCFRIPRQSHWGWDNDQKIQYRRLDSYMEPLEIPIITHPGKNAEPGTTFFHRPLADVISGLGNAGLGIVACRELCSHRRSQSGPFSKAEHRAAQEFPLFLALKAVMSPS
ncbi:MAG: class I SAM-dependent methyltransferase [Verrucomicrobiota bacterium]